MKVSKQVDRYRLFLEGAIVGCWIKPPPLVAKLYEKAGMPVPVRFVQLVVDTGANLSFVDENVIAALKLKAHRDFVVTGISQKPERNLGYRVTLAITSTSGSESVETLAEVGAGRKPGQFDGVIGRDIMWNCRLVYDGHRGSFELAFVNVSET